MVRVKPHVRRGSPVREHNRRPPITLRLLNRRRPSAEDLKIMRQLAEHGYGTRSTNALAVRNDEIVLVNPHDLDPKDLVHLISHETNHLVLNRIGEPRASVWLDTRRGPETFDLSKPLKDRIEPTGMYRFRSRKRR